MTARLAPDLERVLEAFSVVTVALDPEDADHSALGEHVIRLLHEIDVRSRSAADRTYQRAMLIGALGAIAALALQQWAHEDPSKANDFIAGPALVLDILTIYR